MPARKTLNMHSYALIIGASVLSALTPLQGAMAQQGPAAATSPAAKPAKPGAAPVAQKSAKPEGDSALKQRVDNLEEQLVDMQVTVGTLESFAKSNGAASSSPTYRDGAPSAEAPTVDTARLTGLESQVRALTAQVQSLNEQIRSLGGQPRRTDTAATAVVVPPPVGGGFGTATVATEGPDPINGMVSTTASEPRPPVAAAAPASGGTDQGNPRQLYETAYGFLLQQDYGAAEAAFDDFLKRFPNDNLAGNAQFWLGESFFVRGQFKPAAAAFLKGYQSYGRSAKAPDSLLKLAMSLGRLGQKDAACSSFSELNNRFPAASADVKSRAAAEKQRSGCP